MAPMAVAVSVAGRRRRADARLLASRLRYDPAHARAAPGSRWRPWRSRFPWPAAAAEQTRAFSLRGFDMTQHTLELRLAHDGAHGGRGFRGDAGRERRDPRPGFLDHAIVDRGVQECAT